MFKISVIIPAFNTVRFIEKAVLSALKQKEVGEVIVINDGSTDGTIQVLENLKNAYPNLKIYTHKDGRNLGRSASRNLGIKKATKKFIAFLDSDDYYLKNRFSNDKILFELNPDIDGIYNAIGVHFYRKATGTEKERLKLTSVKVHVDSKNLFNYMSPKGKGGHFHGNGLTVKKEIFFKTGYFNEDLEVAEDADMWIKMSLTSNLIGGILDKPLSIRGVHENNVFHLYGTQLYNRNLAIMYNSLLGWAYDRGFGNEVISFFWKQVCKYNKYLNLSSTQRGMKFKDWISYGFKYPRLFTNPNYLKSFPVIRFLKRQKSKLL